MLFARSKIGLTGLTSPNRLIQIQRMKKNLYILIEDDFRKLAFFTFESVIENGFIRSSFLSIWKIKTFENLVLSLHP